MMDLNRQLIQLIGNAVLNNPLPEGFYIENEEALYKLAKHHDMAHLVAYAVDKNGISINEKCSKAFQQQYYQAVRRVSVIESELTKIRDVFEKNGVDFIPLKGAVIRKLYPQEWMRVSADMDILVKPDNVEKAEMNLAKELNYHVSSKGPKHDHVDSPTGFHIDLHRTLSSIECTAKKVLDGAWGRCHVAEGKLHEYVLEDDMFYLFHMYHLSEHFQKGGCGVRPILDTWILNHVVCFDKNLRNELLERSGLKIFAEKIEAISEKWFSGQNQEPMDDVEEYILSGGVYGWNQHMAARVAKKGNRRSYILNRIFPSFSAMRNLYPVIKKVPILLPACWIHRLIKSLFSGKAKRAKYELGKAKEQEKRSVEIAEIYKSLGLQ